MDRQTLKNIRRLNRIVVTLIRYGFGGLVAEMRLFPFLSFIERIFVSRKNIDLSTPVRIRLVLEELGPTFIKLGQIASTRADILQPEWVEEFKKLQDMVQPFPYEDVKKVVEKALKAPLEDRYSSFDTTPVASASIAQVHYAVLRDGTEVAVKVKRPGIERVISSDMAVMDTLARLFERYVPASRRYRPREVVEEFSRVIKNEQDLTVEGAAVNRFYNIFKGNPDIQIPEVHWEYTTEDVLTMERISGTPIDEVETLKARGVDIKKAAIKGIEIFFKQVFDYGVFHADLHPGNIFVRDDGVIIYLDFGIVGRIDRDLRKYLASILFYLVRKDYRRMALVHRQMGLIGEDVDIHEFEEALRDITEPIFGRTLEEISISSLLMKLLQTARRFDMTLQPNLLLLQKSMVIIEGVGRQLYPDINMWEVAKPLVYKWMMKERFSPKAVAERNREKAEELMGAAVELPVGINDLVEKALKSRLRVNFALERIETVSGEINDAGKRVAVGVIAAAIITAATLIGVFSEKYSTEFLGLPAITWAGYLIAVLISFRLFGPWRKRRG